MTFKSLMSLGNYGKLPYTPIDRYHSGSGGYHHGSRGGYKKAGGSGAALSALTLLAFLFLINAMQQSLQDNNTTMAPANTAVLLRDGELPVVLDTREEKETKKREGFRESYGSPASTKSPTKNYVRLDT